MSVTDMQNMVIENEVLQMMTDEHSAGATTDNLKTRARKKYGSLTGVPLFHELINRFCSSMDDGWKKDAEKR